MIRREKPVLERSRGQWLGAVLGLEHSGDGEPDVHVVPRGIRVRTDLVRGFDQLLRVRALNAWQADYEVCRDAKAALRAWADTHRCVHCRISRNSQLQLLGGDLERAEKAGGISGGEQLLRIGTRPPGATQLFGVESCSSTRPSSVRA